MSNRAGERKPFRVLVAGGGVAAIETVLATRDIAGEHVSLTVLAPNEEFVYRPMSVSEPFGFARAARYPLRALLSAAGAQLVCGQLRWVDHAKQRAHTEAPAVLEYDALVLAIGAKPYPRYKHAVTIDDRHMDGLLHGLIQDVEDGYLDSIAFVAPGRMAWPLPLYELALMTASRAYDMCVDVDLTIVTPEDRPLAIFGQQASDGVATLLADSEVRLLPCSYAEIPKPGEIAINPGDRRLRVGRVIALPELYGPAVGGLPLSEHGFLRVDPYGRMHDVGPVFAAGDAVDFAVKQGGIGCQQADRLAESIAALAGVDIEPRPFDPELHGVLLTGGEPRYLAAKITGGHGFASRISEEPLDGITEKIAGRYLSPFLDKFARTERDKELTQT
jgi:sulfide:quinone oxidoreductase